MKIKGLIFLFLLFNTRSIWGQNTVQLFITPVFGKQAIVLESNSYLLTFNDTLQFNTIRFYISAIELLKDKKSVWKEKNSFHLIDAEKPESEKISLQTANNPDYNQIRFTFGIDSCTNVSGALGGDLDPTKGMYWTWDNGYINARIEGKSKLCKSRNNEFQFHIGGYRKAVNTSRIITLPVLSSGEINVQLDLKEVFTHINLAKFNLIMSAGKEGALFSDWLASGIKLKI